LTIRAKWNALKCAILAPHTKTPPHAKTQGLHRREIPALDGATASSDTLKIECGASNARAMIVTVPKAGTYLMAKVLANLGMVDLEVHLSETTMGDFRYMSIEEKISKVRMLVQDIPLEVSARMILPGQFGVGHLSCTPNNREILAPFVRILCLREVRHALVSYMRFEARRCAADPLWLAGARFWLDAPDNIARMRGFLATNAEGYLRLVRGIHGWTHEPGVITCRFEDLVGENGAVAQHRSAESVAVGIGLDASAGLTALLGALGQPTLTYSGRRTTLEGFWNSSSEAFFREIGGHEVNELLGYG
jgi:hypothetical protein